MQKTTLSRFASVLYNEAVAEKEKVEKRLERERSQTLERIDAELETSFISGVAEMESECEKEIRLAVSKREAELTAELFEMRSRAAEDIFSRVEKRLREFVKSTAYREFLRRELEKASDEFCRGRNVCLARACDIELIKELSLISYNEIKATDEDIIGGFILQNDDLRLFGDYTLRTALSERKSEFPNVCGLVIE